MREIAIKMGEIVTNMRDKERRAHMAHCKLQLGTSGS